MKLPLNCEVNYYDDFLSQEESNELYHTLLERYKLDQSRIIMNVGGELIRTDSIKILFATDRLIRENSHPKEIHGKSFPWEGMMQILRERVQDFLNKEFELAMCLYYPDGSYFAPYHSDQETSGFNTILPSISLGEVREFRFKEIATDQSYSLGLADGSLLVMGAYCQSRYKHSLLKDSKYTKGRINITFREPAFK